jgi:hypothetical protein
MRTLLWVFAFICMTFVVSTHSAWGANVGTEVQADSEEDTETELETTEMETDEEEEEEELNTESNAETEDGMSYWGDEHTEVDESEQNDEIDIDDDADTATTDDEQVEVESGDFDASVPIAAPIIPGTAASHRSRSAGMAEYPIAASLVEHDQRIRHDVPLQASSWLALMAEAKNYQSNVVCMAGCDAAVQHYCVL